MGPELPPPGAAATVRPSRALPALLAIPRLLLLIVWVLLGLTTQALSFSWAGSRWRAWAIRHWSSGLLWIVGIRVRIYGKAHAAPVLWVANHVSWLDIFVLNHVAAGTFIAKKEIRRWPLIGWLVAASGTLFIDRSSRRAAQEMSLAMADRLKAGERLCLFPEGTTSDGMAVLPFRGALLQAAVDAGLPIQPLALAYYHHGYRSAFAAYINSESLVANLWRLLWSGGVSVDLNLLETAELAVPDVERLGARRALAERLQSDIAAVLQAEVSG